LAADKKVKGQDSGDLAAQLKMARKQARKDKKAEEESNKLSK